MSNRERIQFINHVPLPGDVWHHISKQATRLGILPAQYMAELALQDMMEAEPIESSSEDYAQKAHWILWRAQKRQRAIENVRQLAAIYEKDRSEENADALARACEIVGLDYDEVVKETGQDPFSYLVLESRNGSLTSQCVLWLAELFRTRSSISRVPLERMAHQMGYSDYVLKMARKRFNEAGEFQIVARKSGNRWQWVLYNKEEVVVEEVGTI